MSYSGNVTVGGPADTRELPGPPITKVAVGPMDNNAYLLRCTQSGEWRSSTRPPSRPPSWN
jgi:hypothetical protein